MATIKTTKKDNYNALLALIAEVQPTNATQLTEFINHEIELIERKAAKASGTVSKTAQANEASMGRILAILADCETAVTISEFMEKTQGQFLDNEGKPFSNQKFSALFKKLHDSGLVEKTIIKKKSYFSIVEVEGTDEVEE